MELNSYWMIFLAYYSVGFIMFTGKNISMLFRLFQRPYAYWSLNPVPSTYTKADKKAFDVYKQSLRLFPGGTKTTLLLLMLIAVLFAMCFWLPVTLWAIIKDKDKERKEEEEEDQNEDNHAS